MKAEKLIINYMDEWGLVTEAPPKDEWGLPTRSYAVGDGGDSLCESCSYLISLIYRGQAKDNGERPLQIIWDTIKFWCVNKKHPTLFRRHPNPWYWYKDWNRGTGDQLQNLIIAAGEIKDLSCLLWLMLGWFMRLGFCTNIRPRSIWEDKLEHMKKAPGYKKWEWRYTAPDFRPLFLGVFIRSLYAAVGRARFILLPLYPVVCGTDLFDLIPGALNAKGSPHNYVVKTEQARQNLPTPFSYLARKLYIKFNAVQQLMAEHFSATNPPLDKEWECIIRQW